MITADQLLAHAVGDYILQSDWMAKRKTKSNVAALAHAATYGLPFFFLTSSPYVLAVIFGTHFLIDRYRLARFVCWLKNGPWHPLTATGYPADAPAWQAVWLLIIADNILHVVINGLALAVLP